MSTTPNFGPKRLDGPLRRKPAQPTPANPLQRVANDYHESSAADDYRAPIQDEPVSPVGPEQSPPVVERTSTSEDDVYPVHTVPGVAAAATEEAPAFVYQKPKQRSWRPSRKLVIGVLVLAIAAGAGWFGLKAVTAARHIIRASNGGAPALSGTLDVTQLKGEGSGRVNILILGVGGPGHEGPDLSDTIMVWSLDPKTKDVAMLSIPRDLYVQIPASAKNRSQYGKINSANVVGGPRTTEAVVEKVIGMPIHYYAVVDFSGFKQAVDAVGGVDIDVATALFDKTYPCETGNKYCPYTQPAGRIHMNGLQALRYSRCRHDEPGIGNCGNDYGRAARQQQVIAALRQKALSLGTLTNPLKISALIDAIGDHAKTDLQINEIRKLAGIAKDVNPDKIVNKVLNDAPDNYLIGGVNLVAGAGYVYLPKAGTYIYDDIRDFVKNVFVDHYLTGENARIEVQNGSGYTGLAAKVAASLQLAHYNVAAPTNATTTVPQTEIYDYTGGKKPYTVKYLENRFGVTAQKMALPSPVATPAASPVSRPTATPDQAIEIRIILGSSYQTPSPSIYPDPAGVTGQ